MKFLNKLGSLVAIALATTACVEQDPEIQNFPDPDVDFTYNVAGNEYVVDYYVVSDIQFNNTSAKTGIYEWNFGKEGVDFEFRADESGAMTNKNSANPVVKFKVAGLRNVTLTIEGVGSRTYPLYISDIVPLLSIKSQSDSIIEINKTSIDFKLELPNPENIIVKYEWTFPEGTTYEDGSVIPENKFIGYSDSLGVVEYPEQKVMFKNVGSQQVLIKTYFYEDGADKEPRRLADTYINVQVAGTEAAPTLYYATVKGNIKAVKLYEPGVLPAGTKVLPYDLGVSSGEMPFQLCYGETSGATDEGENATGKQGWIYILDAGKQYYYINDTGGTLGDGKITAMATDGTNVNVMVSNVGGPAFNDPFQGFVDGNRLYYSDRNTGIRYVDQTVRGKAEDKDTGGDYLVKNDWIPYYNKGIAYGAIHTGMYKDKNGLWWWAKDFSGNGIYRFNEAKDIYKDYGVAQTKDAPYPAILSGVKVKAFTLDENRGAMYLWRRGGSDGGFYEYPIPGNTEGVAIDATPVAKVSLEAKPVNTTADEGVYVTQFAIDDRTGNVYFGFRAEIAEGDTKSETAKLGTGVCYYNPDTKTVTRLEGNTDEAMGVTINPNPTKLF